MNPEHYICRGCKTVTEAGGTCETETCPRYSEPREFCDCPNGWHKGAFDEDEWEPIETN